PTRFGSSLRSLSRWKSTMPPCASIGRAPPVSRASLALAGAVSSGALTKDFVEQNRPGDGGVQRTHLAEHGEADQGVRLLSQSLVQPFTVDPDDHAQRPAVVEVR